MIDDEKTLERERDDDFEDRVIEDRIQKREGEVAPDKRPQDGRKPPPDD